MPARIKFADPAPQVALDDGTLPASPADASPADVLISCLVAIPGTDAGSGEPWHVQRHVRLSDLVALGSHAGKDD